MATPVADNSTIRLETYTASTESPSVQPCPRCQGTGWVKAFTPWGCPVNSPCDCDAVAARHHASSMV